MKMTPKQKAENLTEEYGTLAFLVAIEIQDHIPMYTGNLNPAWKFFEDVKKELTSGEVAEKFGFSLPIKMKNPLFIRSNSKNPRIRVSRKVKSE